MGGVEKAIGIAWWRGEPGFEARAVTEQHLPHAARSLDGYPTRIGATLLDLVQYLVTFASGHPILLLCWARPELLEIRSEPWDMGAVIRLEPLPSEESQRLVGNLLGDWSVPEEVRRQLVDGADGNPLFIEEMFRMLVDDGALAHEDGQWVARGVRFRLRTPETVHAVIAARLDRLDPPDR